MKDRLNCQKGKSPEVVVLDGHGTPRRRWCLNKDSKVTRKHTGIWEEMVQREGRVMLIGAWLLHVRAEKRLMQLDLGRSGAESGGEGSWEKVEPFVDMRTWI